MTQALDSSVRRTLLHLLTRRAEERAITIAATLRAAEGALINGRDAEKGTAVSPRDMNAVGRLRLARDSSWTTVSGWTPKPPLPSEVEDERVINLTLQAWSDVATETARPDILSLTCDSLANPVETHTADIAKFVIVLALRSAYRVSYEPECVAELRDAYDSLRRRLTTLKYPPRHRKTASRVGNLLIDLLCLDGWLTRHFGPQSATAYYESFRKAPLGIFDDGRPAALEALIPPTLRGELPEFGEVLNLAFTQPTGVPGLDAITGGLLGPASHRSFAVKAPSRGQPTLPVKGDTDELSVSAEGFENEPEHTEPGGLISLVVGAPGSGKTTLSLILSLRLAELGSVTRYITTEENPDLLRSKARTMAESLSAAFAGVLDEEEPDEPDIDWISGAQFQSIIDVAETLEHEFAATQEARDATLISSISANTERPQHIPFPSVVVIDSLTALLAQASGHKMHLSEAGATRIRRQQLAGVLMRLRDLGVCVILVGGEGDAIHEGLGYLVDNVFTLSLEGTTTPRHPVRLFSVDKTRLQRSSRGSHVFHLGGKAGCSVNPSLHAVLRSLKGRPEYRPNLERRAVLFSGALGASEPQRDIFRRSSEGPFTIADRSHTLVYGVGSSGKSGVALTIALEPRIETSPFARFREYLATHRRSELTLDTDEAAALESARVLVLSFLYDKAYYEQVVSRVVATRFKRDAVDAEARARAIVDVVAIRPGFVDPEWVVGTARQRLRAAELNGTPYTGVVIDGLHNVLMQFPLLQHDPLLWPTLYRLFKTHGLTTISTFTFFGVGALGPSFVNADRGSELAAAEVLFSQPVAQGGVAVSQPLFFHLLVSSCDYSIAMARPDTTAPTVLAPYVLAQLEAAPELVGRRRLWWDPRNFAFIAQPLL